MVPVKIVLYGFGYNGFGQLQLSGKSALTEPTLCFEEEIKSKKELSVAHFLHHSWSTAALLCEDGILALQGFVNDQAQVKATLQLFVDLKINSKFPVLLLSDFCLTLSEKQQLVPFTLHNCTIKGHLIAQESSAKLPPSCLELKIIFVSKKMSSDSVVLITEDKIIQLERQDHVYKILPEIHCSYQVRSLSCGKDHTVLVTTSGNVYSWGLGSRGQLGHGNLMSVDHPTLVEALDGLIITEVSCGGWHTLALAESKDVYAWGWNQSGQVGLPAPMGTFATNTRIRPVPGASDGAGPRALEPVAIVTTPQLLELEEAVTDASGFVSVISVACGSRHSAVATSCGHLVTWGWGKYGQLGQQCCCSGHSQAVDLYADADDAVAATASGQVTPLNPLLQSLDPGTAASGSAVYVRTNTSGAGEQGSSKRHTAVLRKSSYHTTCKNPIHTPGAVFWFRDNGFHVVSVSCGDWNTVACVRRKAS